MSGRGRQGDKGGGVYLIPESSEGLLGSSWMAIGDQTQVFTSRRALYVTLGLALAMCISIAFKERVCCTLFKEAPLCTMKLFLFYKQYSFCDGPDGVLPCTPFLRLQKHSLVKRGSNE